MLSLGGGKLLDELVGVVLSDLSTGVTEDDPLDDMMLSASLMLLSIGEVGFRYLSCSSSKGQRVLVVKWREV